MKRVLLLLLALSVALLAPLAPGADAASFELSVDPGSVSICPCSSVTPELVRVSARNLLNSADTYVFTMDVPASWAGNQNRIELEKAVGPGQERALDLLLINPGCGAVPGTYDVAINAVSGLTGDRISRALRVEVLRCYGVSMDVDPSYKESCSEAGGQATFDLSVTNTGKFDEEFALRSPVPWATFSDNSVTLASGRNAVVRLTLAPPAGTMGIQTVGVTAKLDRITAFDVSDSEQVQLNVVKCYDFEASIQPGAQTACKGLPAAYTLLLANKGQRDTYTLSAPEGVTLGETTVTLDASESREIPVSVVPAAAGKLPFQVQVTSQGNPQLSRSANAVVDSSECRAVSVAVSPGEKSVCSGFDAQLDVAVRNTGSIEETVILASSIGTLGSSSFMLGPGDSATTTLDIDAGSVTGPSTAVTVTASVGGVSAEANATLAVEECHSSTLSVSSPEQASACAGTSASYTVTAANTGSIQDGYVLTVESPLLGEPVVDAFTLGPGENKAVDIQVPVAADASAGTYGISASLGAESGGAAQAANSSLVVKARSTCFSVALSNGGTESVMIGKAVAVPITVKNTGELPDSYQLTYQGPEWLYMSPDSVSLDAAGEQAVYLYLSPSLETQPGQYSARVLASSANAVSEIAIPIAISQSENETTVTIQPGGINVTIGAGNITGLLTGEDGSLWKVLLVAAITLVIIGILVVRFVLLLRG
jgi:uncharacterized membrane protein